METNNSIYEANTAITVLEDEKDFLGIIISDQEDLEASRLGQWQMVRSYKDSENCYQKELIGLICSKASSLKGKEAMKFLSKEVYKKAGKHAREPVAITRVLARKIGFSEPK